MISGEIVMHELDKSRHGMLLIGVIALAMICACSNLSLQIEKPSDEIEHNVISNPDDEADNQKGQVNYLKASELVGLSLEKPKIVNDITEEFFHEVIQRIKLVSSTDTCELYGEDGCYLSKTPVFYFDVVNKSLCENVRLVIFSKDFSKSMEVHIYRGKEEIRANLLFNWNDSIENLLKENQKEEYIFFQGEKGYFVLDSTNRVVLTYPLIEYEIEGDVYQTLFTDALAVSYEKLTAEGNLLWIEFE